MDPEQKYQFYLNRFDCAVSQTSLKSIAMTSDAESTFQNGNSLMDELRKSYPGEDMR